MGVGTLFGWKKTSDGAPEEEASWLRSRERAFVVAVSLHVLFGARSSVIPRCSCSARRSTPVRSAWACSRRSTRYTPVLGMSLVACSTSPSSCRSSLLLFKFAHKDRRRLRRRRRCFGTLGILAGIRLHDGHATARGGASSLRRLPWRTSASCSCSSASRGPLVGRSDKETTMSPGDKSYQVERLTLAVHRARAWRSTTTKRMVFADVRITRRWRPRSASSSRRRSSSTRRWRESADHRSLDDAHAA